MRAPLPLHIPRSILLRNPVLQLHDSARGIAVHDERDILERLDKHTPAVMQEQRRTPRACNERGDETTPHPEGTRHRPALPGPLREDRQYCARKRPCARPLRYAVRA